MAGQVVRLPESALSIDVVRLRFADGAVERRFCEETFYAAKWLRMLLMLCSLVPLAATGGAVVKEVLPILSGPIFRKLLQSVAPRCRVRTIFCQVIIFLCAMPHVEMLLSGIPRGSEAQPGLRGGAPEGFLQLLVPVFLHSFSARFVSRLGVHGLALSAKLLTAQRRRDNEAHQIALLYVAGCLIGHFIEYTQRLGFQRRQQLVLAAEASRRADSRLNHIIKNKSAEACYVMAEMEDCVLQMRQGVWDAAIASPGVSLALAPPHDGAELDANLTRLLGFVSSVRSIHTQTSEWIHRREMFLQLQKGKYQSRMLPSNLGELIQAVMSNNTDEVQIHVPQPPVLELDAGMLRVQLEEARSNALKYRAPGSCLTLHAELQKAQHSTAGAVPTNGDAWELHVSLDNLNREGVPLLSADQCEAVFREGVKGDYDRRNSLGNGVGLDNVSAAARALGGRAWLSAYVDHASEQAHTVFHTVLPVRIPAAGVANSSSPVAHDVAEPALNSLAPRPATPSLLSLAPRSATPTLPSPRVQSVSPSSPQARTEAPWAVVAPSPVKQPDSPMPAQWQRAISRGITFEGDTCCADEYTGGTSSDRESPPVVVGESPREWSPSSDNAGDVLELATSATSPDVLPSLSGPAHPPAAAASLPLDGVELQDAMRVACGRPPLCFGLDDSPLLQRALLSCFGRLGADPMSRATGTTCAEQEGFVPLVLGHGPHARLPDGGSAHADIVVLDQNLSATDEERPTGLSRARALVSCGFDGMIVLHTSYSAQDLGDADSLSHVDLVLDKAGNPRDLARRIGAAYLQRAARLRRDPPPSCPSPPQQPSPPHMEAEARLAFFPTAVGPPVLRLAVLSAAVGVAAAGACLFPPDAYDSLTVPLQ
jgi:hypothetical protein